MSNLSYTGRVAIVTGAGTGLGRTYALLLASRGARVVVNDLGSDRNGLGVSKQADDVVAEIRAAGGIAVANYNSVIDGDQIIQTALEHFGRIDILINNAGILRDRSFVNISDKDWDMIQDVHLKGAFKTTRAAWPIFRKQNYGRIILTSSNSAVMGNFGQANYAAAKMALIGLANTLAIEGAKYNIHCNVIVPTAASRMTEDLWPELMVRELRPALIAPVVIYMCHESNAENGTVIDSAAGWAAKVHMVRGAGTILRKSLKEDVTLEAVRDNWEKIVDMSNARHFSSSKDSRPVLLNALEQQDNYNPNSDVTQFRFGPKEVSLYALGIGVDISDSDNLKYLYENHKQFTPFPTFFVLQSMLKLDLLANALKHVKFELKNLLHGEHYIEIEQLPTAGNLTVQTGVEQVLDKRSGAVIVLNSESRNESGSLVARCQSSLFILGAGNFGGPTKPSERVKLPVPAPQRRPDVTIRMKTTKNQAAIYRLSGDSNPLHIDPVFANQAGRKEPILHGLCTMGFAARAVLQTFADNDAERFRAMKVRFMRPVVPGETLQVDMWRSGDRIHFVTKVVETGLDVLTGAYVDLKPVVESKL